MEGHLLKYLFQQFFNPKDKTDSPEKIRLIEANKPLIINWIESKTNCDHERILALGRHLDFEFDLNDVTVSGDYYISVDGTEYIVCTDEEADELFEDRIKDHFNDIVLTNIPEGYRRYMDFEKFKSDEYQERGEYIAYYDGEEHEEHVDGTTYFIYKNS